MDKKINVVIVDDIKETRNNIKTLLQFDNRIEIVGEAENGQEAIEAANTYMPDIILMDVNMPIKDGIKATEEISLTFPNISVIIISVQGDQEYLRKAMSAGAKDFITKPFSGDDLVNTIIKTYDIGQIRRQKNSQKNKEKVSAKVITVFSTKGGVGKTTIATNIAVSLAKETGERVALIDCDLQFGNVGIFLNVPIKNTIVDLIKESNEFDGKLIEEYLVPHYSGVNILLSPIKPEYSEFITPSHIEKIVNGLKDKYHYIVIDTSSNMTETVLTCLDLADKVLFVSTIDLPTIKNTKEGIEIMESLNYSKDKICIVANKVNEQYGIKIKDLEDTIKYPVFANIPEDNETIITSINKGFPFVLTRAETKCAKGILSITEKLTDDQEQNDKKKSIFNIFKK